MTGSASLSFAVSEAVSRDDLGRNCSVTSSRIVHSFSVVERWPSSVQDVQLQPSKHRSLPGRHWRSETHLSHSLRDANLKNGGASDSAYSRHASDVGGVVQTRGPAGRGAVEAEGAGAEADAASRAGGGGRLAGCGSAPPQSTARPDATAATTLSDP